MKSNIGLAVLATLAFASFNASADMINPNQQPQAEVIHAVPEGTVIPMLEVKYDCGDCQADNKIKALIEGSYLDRAQKEKADVNEDDDNKVVYTVTNFRSRGKARLFVGALAGADNIKGTVECNGKAMQVSDTAISAFSGIEAVARNVGVDAYKAVKDCVLSGVASVEKADVSLNKSDIHVEVQ